MNDLNGGVHFDQLTEGERLVLTTLHRKYLIEACGGLNARISGHPDYCPEPTPVVVMGARDHGSRVEHGLIAPGMRLEFWHPTRGIVRTSALREVRRVLQSESR